MTSYKSIAFTILIW